MKKKIRHEKWREEISECQSSGLQVKEWCENKGLNTNTYYNRLRVIREEILERVHIKRASKIIANMITERKIESSLS